MRRSLQVAVNYVAPLVLLWVALTISGITLQVLSAFWSLVITAAWVVWRIAEAVGDVLAIVREAVARRAKQRRWREHVARTKHLVDGLRVGSEPQPAGRRS